MYIKPTSIYYKGTAQHTRRAPFLVMMQSDSLESPASIRCVVRQVALAQLGQWMMGTTRIGKEKVTLSGSYGADGLPITVRHETFLKGLPLPNELYELWNKGGGWNSAGSEAEAIQQWALTNLDALSPKR